MASGATTVPSSHRVSPRVISPNSICCQTASVCATKATNAAGHLCHLASQFGWLPRSPLMTLQSFVIVGAGLFAVAQSQLKLGR
jgi:hypothetical protein